MRYRRLPLLKRAALELERILQREAVREHVLKQVFWECTLRCDLSCRHCGSDCKTKSDSRDMPVDDFLKVLMSVAQKYNPHDVFVTVSGGEPLMRLDLEECGRRIYKLGFPWGVVTNALHLTPARLEKLVDAGMHSMAVSLDGLEDDHNWMRGNPSSFKMVEQAIRLLSQQSLVVWDVVTCVNERNFSSLPQMRDWLIAHGTKMWRIIDIFPAGRAAGDSLMLISDRHYRQMLDFIRDTQKQYPQISVNYGCAGFVGEYEFDVRETAFQCHAGVSVAGVMANGDIAACTSIRSGYAQGNIYHDDFMEVWENKFQQFRNHDWMKTGPCADCNMWRYCRGNGIHLRDGEGKLLQCHLQKLVDGQN